MPNPLNWLTDVNVAIEISNKENKPLLLYLQIKCFKYPLFSQVLNTLDFALWSRDNVVIVKIDLPRRRNEDIDRNLNLKVLWCGLIPQYVLQELNA
jgi:protein disulfide-isomerase